MLPWKKKTPGWGEGREGAVSSTAQRVHVTSLQRPRSDGAGRRGRGRVGTRCQPLTTYTRQKASGAAPSGVFPPPRGECDIISYEKRKNRRPGWGLAGRANMMWGRRMTRARKRSEETPRHG